MDIQFDDVPVARNGVSAGTDPALAKKVFDQESFTVGIDLNQGDGEALIYSCDATESYIRLNVK